MEIRTERLVLRPARAGDAAALWRVFSDPEAMRYWSTLPHADPEETRALVEGLQAQPEGHPYFVVDAGGTAIGTAGFWQGSEVGFLLRPDHWGRGLGGELLDALIAHGFGPCGFARIDADVDPRNDASIGLLESRGFRETGRAERTIQLGDVWADSVYFSLERSR